MSRVGATRISIWCSFAKIGFYVGVENYVPIDDDPKAVAQGTGFNTRSGCRRIAEFAFEYAIKHGRKKVTIVHKANILKYLTGLFLETAYEVGEQYKDQITIEDKIVDNCAMQLVLNPSQYDVIVTTNMFGDILSDEIAGLVGGLGLAPGGNIGKHGCIFEAVHGTAPDIAGQGKANPTAVMLAAAMMLEHVHYHDMAEQLRTAIHRTIDDNIRTMDLGGSARGFRRSSTAWIDRRQQAAQSDARPDCFSSNFMAKDCARCCSSSLSSASRLSRSLGACRRSPRNAINR